MSGMTTSVTITLIVGCAMKIFSASTPFLAVMTV
jgi:hypothetical protein